MSLFKKIDEDKYFKTSEGKYSSTRKNSYELLQFFKWFNIIVWPLIAYFSYGDVNTKLDPNWLIALLSFNALLLIGIFVPKQLKNISEVRKIVELAKVGNNKKEEDE